MVGRTSLLIKDMLSARKLIFNLLTQINKTIHKSNNKLTIKMIKRAAGFLIYRLVSSRIEYLLLKASYGELHWTPPKGHVDPGEDDYTTALRETREEAGFTENDLKIYKDLSKTLNYNVKGKPKVVVYWLAELVSGRDPTLSDEHTDFKFVTKEQISTLSTYPDFLEMVDYFDNEIKKIHKL
ncbi:CLUMA_CG015842, isoform A [Clunio marinus]|uniref:Bis(5'-nucleosyl)-tetraphosphatase [asymmetrical] n=1 Tax=Clunio marinus TaxID=568069 RepID=A0A1J1ISN5_9DIPT|nr:CLUMA_CG015842, isoform A [Clunio marinus]